MNDARYEIVEGKVLEPAEDPKRSVSARKRGSLRTDQIPKPGSKARGQRADLDDGEPTSAAAHAPFERDLHPLLKARAEEFARRHEAMRRAYEQALFGTMADALEATHQPPVEEQPKLPLIARLASSCGEALMQAGRRLAQAAEPDSRATESPDPKEAEGGPTVIVFTKDGGIDD